MAGPIRVVRALSRALLLLVLSACAKKVTVAPPETIRVGALAAAAVPPANVALYVGVTDDKGAVTDLDASSFEVYENDERVPPSDAKLTLLPRDLVTSEHVVLLVDLSGKLGDEERASYARAVEAFVRKLQTTLSVTVLGYAGDAALKPIGDYPRANSALEAPTPSAVTLARLPAPDSSRDLYGAVVRGLETLGQKLSAEQKPIQLGTLVVFARGPDLAGRLSDEEMEEAIQASQSGIIGIAMSEDTEYLEFAKNGLFIADDPASVPNALPIAFEEAAARVMKAYRKYYLVQYCSPARSGKRRVRLEVHQKTDAGAERLGVERFEFEADGFSDGCDPEAAPSFAEEP